MLPLDPCADPAVTEIDGIEQALAYRIAQFAVADGDAAVCHAQVVDHAGHAVHAPQRGGRAGLVDDIGYLALQDQRAVRQPQLDGGMEYMPLIRHMRQGCARLRQHRFASLHFDRLARMVWR
ncbi:hypothetical protein D3C81_1801780 [compost metagenome]